MTELNCVASDVLLGRDVRLSKFINLYGCSIGDETKIGAFVEIQKNATVGSRCKISSHTFICEGVTIEDNVFIGHGVSFVNDSFPRATNSAGELQTEADWKVEKTLVKRGASIGSGATILSNVTIGEEALVGAGSVVTKDVAPRTVVAGNPARFIRSLDQPKDEEGEIPFLDLITPHLELEDDLIAVTRQTLRSAAFVGGSAVEKFEREFAEFCEVDHAVGVSSGTDALRFALMASGVQPGDAVITVPHTFVATTEAIGQAGAEVEFIDIDELTYNMSPERLHEFLKMQCHRDKAGRLISKRSGRPVTAIVPVHLYGQMADMDAILSLADQYELKVIEDACQAHGAEYYSEREQCWRKAGSMGSAAAFSFYPGKNLGACGEAGAATTSDAKIAVKMRMLRDHGQAKKYFHDIEGYNGRLDALQAGYLSVKLPYLAKWNEQRRICAAEYGRLLGGRVGIALPVEPEHSKAVYHLYVIRVTDREGLMRALKEAGIGTGIHYPVPLHRQKAYSQAGYRAGDFPVATRVAEEIVSLPVFPGLTLKQQARVAEAILDFIA